MSDLQDNFNVVLNAFPSIAKKIKLFWGYQDFTDLMQDLLYNTRDHSRAGFPLAVATALFELQTLHDRTFPQLSEKSSNERTLSYRPLALDESQGRSMAQARVTN